MAQVEHFQARLRRAMERVRLVLDTTRKPCFAADVHHQYQDKYMLAESMTNAALASQANTLAALGLTPEQLGKMISWAKASAVSLRFRSEERCTFLREETREVENPTKQVVEASVTGLFSGKMTSKTVTKVTEYFWKYETSYELWAIRGVGENAEDLLSILKRGGQVELKTTIKEPPHPTQKVPAASFEVNISWLVKLLELEKESTVPQFGIDRANKACHTPRRNPEVSAALQHFNSFLAWASQVAGYLMQLLQVQPNPDFKLDLTLVSDNKLADSLFAPVLPLFEDKAALLDKPVATADASSAAAASDTSSTLLACLSAAAEPIGSALGVADTNCFLSEEARLLNDKRQELMKSFPVDDTVATAAEAVAVATLRHSASVCRQWAEALDYIENMLRKQLIAAIGKEVMPADFADYMTFHNRKLFADAYAPVPFCFAVRRSEQHSPEGTLSIEQETVGGDSNIAAPIVTLVARSPSREHQMEFPLSASANVTFGGDKLLHAWLSHKFSGDTGASLSLVSKTRQFSSFIVLVGRIASARAFDPKYAAIVQNKDELKIPLDLSTIPTPKEFKDAIESLSPQQQAFAKAFRSMQLESTLFGILVIQIKPQLERVLNLSDDSLTKEIKLTQELMQLFIKYQIPSDLLAFDSNNSPEGAQLVGGGTPSERLAAVKGHVKAMYEMIGLSQQEEVQQRLMEERYAHPQVESPPSSDCSEEEERMDECEAFEECAMAAPVLKKQSSFSRMASGARSMASKMKSAAPAQLIRSRAAAAPPPAPMAGAAMPPSPAASQQQDPSQQQDQAQQQSAHDEAQETVEAAARDYTQVPKEMDANFERLDVDSQLRPTIITPAGSWTKRAQKALLASPTTSFLDSDEQKKEKDAAFDLLDALTKSGALPVEHASLHIVVAATHCFDKSVTETVVQDNVNPIDKVERSTLIMATTVHQQPTSELIRDAQLPRVQASSPMLFLTDEAAVEIS